MRHLSHTARLRAAPLVVAAGLLLAACGSDDTTASAGSGNGDGAEQLTITSPEDGATVRAPFTLTWDSSVPLGPPDSGKDHVHVYVDGNEDDYTVVGGDQFRVKNLAPGEHEVEVALQHADHTPVGPEASITVTVSGAGGDTPTPSSDEEDDGGGYGY